MQNSHNIFTNQELPFSIEIKVAFNMTNPYLTYLLCELLELFANMLLPLVQLVGNGEIVMFSAEFVFQLTVGQVCSVMQVMLFN